MRNWSGSLSGILVSRLDQALMVPLCSSTAQLGLYAVAVSISELPLVVNQAVRDVTFAAESQGPDADRLARATRLSTALTGAAAAAVGVLSVLFLTTLFGHDFAGAVVVTLVLLVAVVGGNPGSVAGMGLSARGRPGLRSLSLSLALVVDVVALVLLVPVLGAMGAALATLVANCTCAALNLYWLRRVFGLPVGSFLGLRRSDLTGATALVRRRMIRSAAR
jgi:O-antigen/teichoic acid export membrane protein